jgi:hypothetical protein
MVRVLTPQQALDRAARSDAPPELDAILAADDAPGGRRRLLCRACGHPITTEADSTTVEGAHEHVKRNPAGLVFRIGCFRAAPGAAGWGDAFAEHTWFAGYTWQIALCAGCGVHLGWAFHSDGSSFHGLVTERLRLDLANDRL